MLFYSFYERIIIFYLQYKQSMQSQMQVQALTEPSSSNQKPVFEFIRPIQDHQKPTNFDNFCTVSDPENDPCLKISIKTGSSRQEWVSFFEKVAKINAKVLQMWGSHMPGIVNILSRIQFTRLRDLNGNNIVSIENFHKMNLPQLKTLRIDENQISSLRSLKKCSFPLLEQIDMENNQWSDPHWLVQMNAPKLRVVRLEDWTDRYPRNDDKRWFSKLQTADLDYIRCPSSTRLRQSDADQMLKRKYPKLNVMRNNSQS